MIISKDIQTLFYIISSILFVFGLKMLGRSETARKGNAVSAVGMLLAIIIALLSDNINNWQWIVLGLAVGSLVGALAAKFVAMTAMPEMVALFNGFGGIASLLVGWVEFHKLSIAGELFAIHPGQLVIIMVTVLIGGITFTGSVIAWGKLSQVISSKPVLYPGQQIVNSLLLIIAVGTVVVMGPARAVFSEGGFLSAFGMNTVLIGFIVLAGLLGILSVIPIGGGDMPVVISLLNSYSGMAACAAGFVIQNNVLIVSGALVGSSGIILTTIMCKAMNRSLSNVLFSGFGSGSTASGGTAVQGEAKPVSIEDAFIMLEAAKRVVFVPGYGMAVAQAQHILAELADKLEENGAEVDYAIHPVAGRMPGHMNVLLAEAKVDYDKLKEMDSINPQMEQVDVAVIIGANDVVNPAARNDQSSPLYGMPIINVDKARTVIVLKRSLNPGFAGVENPLFFGENTRMLFGDAKASISGLVSEFKET